MKQTGWLHGFLTWAFTMLCLAYGVLLLVSLHNQLSVADNKPKATYCGKKNCDCGCNNGENCRCASPAKAK